MGEPVLVAVRVLGAELVSAPAGCPDDEWHLAATAEHVADVRGSVHHLVHRHQDEIDGHHLGDRSQPGHGGPDCGADDHLFRDRGVEHPLLAELLHQAAGDLE